MTTESHHSQGELSASERNRYRWWIGLILIPFFARASSLPIPISTTLLYYGCYVGLFVVSAQIICSGAVWARPGVVVLVIAAIPSLSQEGIDKDSALRWCGWVFMLIAIGPLFGGLSRYRAQLWAAMGWLSLIISGASLLVWIVGVQLAGRGNFFGVMSHTMILAPVAGMSLIESLNRYFRTENKLWLATSGAAMINLLLCASRSAMVGASLAVLWMILNVGGLKRQSAMAAISALGLIMMIIDSGFFSQESRDRSTDKEKHVLTEILRVKSDSNTRAWLWEARIAEFQGEPVIGIGFTRTIYGRKSTAGEIEPGSSYLAILSMTGLVGAFGWVFFLTQLRSAYRRAADSLPKFDRLALGGAGVFFAFHLAFEGYIFSCGSFVGLWFWALLGMFYDLVEQEKPTTDRILDDQHLGPRLKF